MQWRQHEHSRLQRDGMIANPDDDGSQTLADDDACPIAGHHCCGAECPEEDEEAIAHKVNLSSGNSAVAPQESTWHRQINDLYMHKTCT